MEEESPSPLGESLLRKSCLTILALAPSLVAGMMVTLVIPLLPAIGEHFGSGDGKLLAQYVMAVAGMGVVIGAVTGGYGVDRMGCRWVMILSLILYVISGLIVPALDDVNELLASRFFIGIGCGAFYAAATALVGQLWTGKSRARLLGYVTAVAGAVGIPSILASGAIADAFGWRAPFFLYALALPLIPLCFAVPVQIRRKQAAMVRVTWAEWRALLPIYLRALPLYIVAFVPFTQLPLILADIGLTNHSDRSMILAVVPVGSGIAAFSFAALSRYFDRSRMFLLVLLLFGLGALTLGIVSGTTTVLLPVILCGVAGGLIHPHFKREVLADAPTHIQGRASGMIVSVHYAAQFLNPPIIGTLAAMITMRHALVVTGIALLLWLATTIVMASSRSESKIAP